MDYTKLKGCHPGGDPVGLKGPDGMNTLSSYQAGRDDMITIIKAEIERRITDNTFGAKLELIDILAWLDSLEEETPMNLEEEIDRLWESFADEMEGPHNLFDIYARLASHFAKWGAEHLKK